VDELVSRAGAEYRERALLISAFAALALLLVALGIYGVVSFAVSQRTREIGIRMAVGADRADVLRHFAWRGMLPVLVGLVSGLVAAVAMMRLLQSLLFGVPALDPVTFLSVIVLIGATAGTAVMLPARRATRVVPVEALRAE
jgi:putative ABC transport system permease protein